MKNLIKIIKNQKAKIAIIGLGYVGLPLALRFSRVGFRVVGYDLNKSLTRIVEIK